MNEPQITRTLNVEDWSLSLWSGDDEPRVRDLDLAQRLGYERPRNIRKLIERRLDDSGFGEVRSTVEQTPSPEGGRPGREYHLTEAQALEIAATSETPNGRTILRALIKVFILARRGMLPGLSRPVEAPLLSNQGTLAAVETFLAGAPKVLEALNERASKGSLQAAQMILSYQKRLAEIQEKGAEYFKQPLGGKAELAAQFQDHIDYPSFLSDWVKRFPVDVSPRNLFLFLIYDGGLFQSLFAYKRLPACTVMLNRILQSLRVMPPYYLEKHWCEDESRARYHLVKAGYPARLD